MRLQRRSIIQQLAFGSFVRQVITVLGALLGGIILVALLSFVPPTLEPGPFGGFRPLPSLNTYLHSVGMYLFGLLSGNLGVTRRGGEVADVLFPAIQHSLILVAISTLLAIPIGMVWGTLLCNTHRKRIFAVLFGANILAISFPTFALLLLLIEALANFTLRTGIRLAYTREYGLDQHLVVPTVVLATRGAAYFARTIYVAQTEIMHQDWIVVARAKGLGGWQLWRRHVAPSLWLPSISGVLTTLRVVVAGIVIVEYLYSWGGLGSLMLSVGSAGVRPTEGPVAASAAGVLVLFFVLVDAVGRFVAFQIQQRRTM